MSSKRTVRRLVDVRRTDAGDAGGGMTTTACEGQRAGSAVQTPEEISLEGSARRSGSAILQNVKQRTATIIVLRAASSTVSAESSRVSLARLLTNKRVCRPIPRRPIPPAA